MPDTSTTQTYVLPHHYAGARPLLALGLAGLPARPSFAVYSTIGGGRALSRPLLAQRCVWSVFCGCCIVIMRCPSRPKDMASLPTLNSPLGLCVSLTSLAFSPVTSHLPQYPRLPFCKPGTCQLQDRQSGGFSLTSLIQYIPTSYPRRTRTDKEEQWFSPPRRTTDKYVGQGVSCLCPAA